VAFGPFCARSPTPAMVLASSRPACNLRT
jgi:hypothetical protein